MVKVKEKVKLSNCGDVFASINGLILKDKIRAIQLEMLVDTGATMIVICEDIAEKLGIKGKKKS